MTYSATTILRKFNDAVSRVFDLVTEPAIGRIERWMDRNPIVGDTLSSLLIVALLAVSIGIIWLFLNIWGNP